MAAAGTPDGAPCNVSSNQLGFTGTAGCVSNWGAFDMVGNAYELVADWTPLASGGCAATWLGFSDDLVCWSGVGTSGQVGAVTRGGSAFNGANAGVFHLTGSGPAAGVGGAVGFRCGQ